MNGGTMHGETLARDQASELYERLAREAVVRNARTRRLRLAGRSGAMVVLAAMLATGAVLATGWGSHGSDRQQASFPRLHPLKSTASPEAIKNASPRRQGIGPLIWQPRLDLTGDEDSAVMSLADARAQAKFPVLAPSSVLPDASIKKVWLRYKGPFPSMVAIVYERLEINEVVGDQWKPAYYRGMAREPIDPGGHLGTVQGETAYIAPPNTDKDGIPHPGYVDFMKNGVRLTVEGYYSEDELLLIANSLE
jgi:hypothetical protein